MPTKLDPKSDRVEACHAAAMALVHKHGSVNKAAKATGLTQQTLNDLVSKKQLGIDFADKLASHYETTVDGLIWSFLKGGDGAVRAGDITGWSKSAEAAEQQWPEYAVAYRLAAEVRLPVAPSVVDVNFVRDLAQFLHNHTRSSQTRVKAQRLAK